MPLSRGGNPQFYTPQWGSVGPTGKCVSTCYVNVPPCATLQYDDNVPGNGNNYNDAYFEISTFVITPAAQFLLQALGPLLSKQRPEQDQPLEYSGSSAGPKSGFVAPLVGTISVSFAGLTMTLTFWSYDQESSPWIHMASNILFWVFEGWSYNNNTLDTALFNYLESLLHCCFKSPSTTTYRQRPGFGCSEI